MLFVVNKSLDEKQELSIRLLDFDGFKPVQFISMDGYDKSVVNSFESETVKPHLNETPKIDNGELSVVLQPFSWNVIRLKK